MSQSNRVRKILVVGSNPSKVSPDNSAFHPDTKSSKVLETWLSDIAQDEVVLVNVLDKPSNDNKRLTERQIKEVVQELKKIFEKENYSHVVALGKTAVNALKMAGLIFFEMPHPSPKNRKLNDKKFIAEKLKELKEYLK